ncbi:hypothetical protein JRQ81_009117 [Phrynocephalus forsythii]|uniref:Uncharacterized protein n=1 Tax=Phrynocephalus forsythii TaxID=171643 RepID=A0A9Q0X972_9SAUR|nr:hypothetical protein JRQ81_009117 [Phrynocephalus forsythii]
MGGLLWLLWFFLGSSAIHHTVAGSQQEDVVLLRSWGSLALSSAMVLIVVVVVKWLGKKSHSEDVREIKEDVLKSQEELKSSLWQALSQMEQELVKLVTLVRSRKARLAAGHHSCKASECQEERGSTHKPFNLAVYDIVEGD